MSDYNERACTYCGSYLHHENDCPQKAEQARPWLLVCPECKKRCGRERSGAEFQGQAICNNCDHVWPIGFRLLPGY